MASSLKDKLKDAKDDEIVADYSTARDSLPDLEDIPKGTYDAVVVECEKGTSEKGNGKVVFKFEIVEDQQVEGHWPTGFRHAPYEGDGSGIFRDTVAALGFDPEDPFKCSAAIDRECVIVVGGRKGEPGRTEIKKVRPRTAAAAKPAAKKATTAGRRRVG